MTTLALHGFTGSARSWDFLGPRVGPPLLTPTLVGHAGSDASDSLSSFEAEVTRLAQLLPAAGAAHVLGYSLGARLALGIALHAPERVARLTLVSGHPGLGSEAERSARRAADAAWIEILETRGLEAFVDAWQAQPLWASQAQLPPDVRRRKREERLSHRAAGLAHSLRVVGLAEMPDYTERLRELRIPVCLVAGESDTKFRALAERMAEQVTQAELALVPGAGHDLLLERPEAIAELVSRHPAARSRRT